MPIATKETTTTITTLGALKSWGYEPCTVKDELRRNLLAASARGVDPFEGILGYEDTVIPELHNAIISRHDILLIGLRGQAKSRIARSLYLLLDAYVPVVEGSALNDDPLAPKSKGARDLIAAKGDETPIAWMHRSERYAEKLATPDTNMADLIGDIDPIKAANLRLSYADEEAIHFGIVPRMNRGIFTINELPDLQARIQVGLLNILEEEDIQIRSFKVRYKLDMVFVFTANPDDYTNRGAIITPLKDRIDSQIVTHYPKTLETAVSVTELEAWSDRDGAGAGIVMPRFVKEIVEWVAIHARHSEFVDQRAGVSVRMTRAAHELVISEVERRMMQSGDHDNHIRILDLYAMEPAIVGKLELVYEGEQEGPKNVARHLIGQAIHTIFVQTYGDPKKDATKDKFEPIRKWFERGGDVRLSRNAPLVDYEKALQAVTGLESLVTEHIAGATPRDLLMQMEFVLEGLAQCSVIAKQDDAAASNYRDFMGSIVGGLDAEDDLDLDEEI